MGVWSTRTTSLRRSTPVRDLIDAGGIGAVALARVRGRTARIEDLVDQRGLAGAGDAGDGDQQAEGDFDVEAVEVVGVGSARARSRSRPGVRRRVGMGMESWPER